MATEALFAGEIVRGMLSRHKRRDNGCSRTVAFHLHTCWGNLMGYYGALTHCLFDLFLTKRATTGTLRLSLPRGGSPRNSGKHPNSNPLGNTL